jgi:endonuclease/exonuclease/phosphatase family metal-dependent hydrolase
VLRVVSYNVHGLRDDRAALVEVVRDLAPDVLILQEAPRRLRWRTRAAHLAHDFGLVYAAGGEPAVGNMIMTALRVRVLDAWALRYPLVPGHHLRGAAFARCVVEGAPFVVAGTHLSTHEELRPGQGGHLAKALADLGPGEAGTAETVPVILGGDLNEPPGGPAWQAFLDGAGLVDAGTTEDPTFPAAGPRHRIDAVFVDPRIAVTGYRVVSSAAAARASDHLPVVAELVPPAGVDKPPPEPQG